MILFCYGVGMVKQEFILKQVSTTMQYPQWIYGLTIPIGAGIMILRYIYDTYLKFIEFREEGQKS